MVRDAVNVRLRGRTRLLSLTMGFSLDSCWRNRTQGVQEAAVNSFSLRWGQPAELKGSVRMLLQLLNSKHHWKKTSWEGTEGTCGLGGWGRELLSWDELLGLKGWFCPLVVRGLGTPEFNDSQYQGNTHHWMKAAAGWRRTLLGISRGITQWCDLSFRDPGPTRSSWKGWTKSQSVQFFMLLQ